MDPLGRLRARTVSAAQALAGVRRGGRVFVGSGCAEPTLLVEALAAKEDVTDVEVLHIMTVGHAPYAKAAQAGRFRHNAFFIGTNVREAVAQGHADYTPVFLSEVPALLRSGRLPLDVALITLSPPDRHGYCSLGVSVDVVRAAVDAARIVVAEINPNMPRTHGAGFVHVDDVDAFVRSDAPILEIPRKPLDETSLRIGRLCAALVPDGATLQLGIGTIPDAVLAGLRDKRDLGIHSEMIADGVMDLIQAGVITCRRKNYHPGRAIASFCMGTRALYDFVHDNPFFEFLPTEMVNDPFNIAKNDGLISINSALQVDLTGQVCADSIGSRFYSGIGGQVDFIRGAARSRGGRSILALPSTARGGALSRIVPVLTEGAGVVTTRGDVDTIVTEHGVAELKGRSVRERALALISVAHPDFRGDLLAAAKARHVVAMDQAPWPREGRPYPVELESEETFKGARIFFRPIRPSDERALRDFFYSHSAETVHQRYHAPLKSLTPAQIQHFCTVDYDRHMALVGFEGERMAAVGRYILDPATGLAEVAFTVHDELQCRGIGTWLLGRLMRIARERGVKGFLAYVLADNVRMLNVFHRCGVPGVTTFDAGVYTITMRFDGGPGEEPGSPPQGR